MLYRGGKAGNVVRLKSAFSEEWGLVRNFLVEVARLRTAFTENGMEATTVTTRHYRVDDSYSRICVAREYAQ